MTPSPPPSHLKIKVFVAWKWKKNQKGIAIVSILNYCGDVVSKT